MNLLSPPRIVVTLICACLSVLAGCSSPGSTPADPSPGGLEQDLRTQLLHELAVLGKDPDRTPAAAPAGNGNAVFNLSAEVIDADGEGGAAPTGVLLQWTARIVGDYDQNGEVGIADITPLGQFFKQAVAYDPPGDHDGITFWPQGDPFADGAANWRAAAVDGDGNGEINAADITPIAIHFGERIDGFNVYIKPAGETEFSILPNLVNPFAPASVSLKPAGNGPANYSVEIPWPSSGMAEIAVAGYDDTSGSAAALSNVVSVSGDPGPPPASCSAELTVDLQSGEAPLTVQFGLGSSSTGPEGSHRYVLSTGEGSTNFSFEDSADFPVSYSYLTPGSYMAQLAVVCLVDGQVAFSDQLQVDVTEPPEPGLTLNGFVWQYEENPVLGDPEEPAKNPLEGIEVELYLLGGQDPIATVESGGSGEYVFANLQLPEGTELLNVKISAAQKEALLPLTWLPAEHIIVIEQGQLTVTAPDMNLLAEPI